MSVLQMVKWNICKDRCIWGDLWLKQHCVWLCVYYVPCAHMQTKEKIKWKKVFFGRLLDFETVTSCKIHSGESISFVKMYEGLVRWFAALFITWNNLQSPDRHAGLRGRSGILKFQLVQVYVCVCFSDTFLHMWERFYRAVCLWTLFTDKSLVLACVLRILTVDMWAGNQGTLDCCLFNFSFTFYVMHWLFASRITQKLVTVKWNTRRRRAAKAVKAPPVIQNNTIKCSYLLNKPQRLSKGRDTRLLHLLFWVSKAENSAEQHLGSSCG